MLGALSADEALACCRGRRRSSGIDLPLLCSNITIYLTGIEANDKVARASRAQAVQGSELTAR